MLNRDDIGAECCCVGHGNTQDSWKDLLITIEDSYSYRQTSRDLDHTFVCIHSYALSLNHTSCFPVYLHVSYTQAILWVLELDTLCSYFTGRRPYFVIITNLLDQSLSSHDHGHDHGHGIF